MQDSLSTIFRSAASFLTGTALSRLTGLLRDISLAFAFGATPEVAALLVAFRLSHLARRLLGEGAMQQAFIPLFEEIRKEEEQTALSFFKTLTWSLSFLLIALIILSSGALLFLDHFIAPENHEIVILTLLMLPSLLFICLYGLNASLLQCERKYFAPAAAPVAFNLVWVLGAFLFKDYPQASAMRWMTLAINCACLGQWAATLPFIFQHTKGVKLLPSLFPEELKKLIKRIGLGIVGVAAIQVSSAIDPLFARFADLSGPAWLWYAIRIEQFPLAIFAIALSSALLPPLSRAIRRQDAVQFQHFLEHAIKKSAGLMIPLSLLFIALSRQLITLIFGYGEFDSESIAKTSQCLQAYSLGLLPSTFILIFASAFFAQNNYKTPAIGSILTMLSNLLINTLCIFVLGFGSISVALATSFAAFINALYLQRRLLSFPLNIFRTLISALVAFGSIYFTPDLANNLADLVVKSLAFVFVLSGMGFLLKAHDLLFWETNRGAI